MFDILALFRASQGNNQRHTDEVILRKLIDEGLLIPAQDGYKLSERYDEIDKNVGTVENTIQHRLRNGPRTYVKDAPQNRPDFLRGAE